MSAKLHLFWRGLVALFLTLLVMFGTFKLWQWQVRVDTMPGVSGGIGGFAYTPFRRDQSPLEKKYPTPEQVAEDLDILSNYTHRIRTYGVTDVPAIYPLAEEKGFKVAMGLWVSADKELSEREIATGLALLKKHKNIERIVVGNEALLRKEMTVQEMAAHLDRVRADIRRQFRKGQRPPVSTAEPWHVWLANPELVDHVDYLMVHLLPYHEGISSARALEYAFSRYEELRQKFPKKPIVIGEIGWPTRGEVMPNLMGGDEYARAASEDAARFVRGFLADPRSAFLDYYIMEAFDQPWKVAVEGWAGAYWGVFDADRHLKYPLDGLIVRDVRWKEKARLAVAIAAVPMFLIAFALGSWNVLGRLWLMGLVQLSAAVLVVGVYLPKDYYLSRGDLVGLVFLIVATLMTIAVLLSHGFEFGEVLFKRQWRRRFTPREPLPPEQQPFVSIHLACYNEPPEMVIATIDSLARLDYANYEVIVVDNNTTDEALWKPVEAHCATLGPRFRFFHLPKWPGFKAGALNFALKQTDPRAEIVGVVDADYVVEPDWLARLVPHFLDSPQVAVVQAPQAHRDFEHSFFQRMCNWEFEGFFRIGMHHRNERNALIQHGTMTLIRRRALEEVGGWSEWCICEDTELGLRLIELGYETRYVDHIFGRGLTPSDFAAIKSQRFRWAFGAMQILKAHLPKLLGLQPSKLNFAQRYHFLTGWFAWFGDALHLVFALASIYWTLGMIHFPKTFALPVASLAMPVLGFMAFKTALGPVLYRRTMHTRWIDILGASILSVGLAHTIARGVFAGLFQKKGTFVRTPKGWRAKGTFAFFGPIREELGLLAAILIGAAVLVAKRGLLDLEVKLWLSILMLQAIPYLAAVLCQIIAYLPDNAPPEEQAAKPLQPQGGHAPVPGTPASVSGTMAH